MRRLMRSPRFWLVAQMLGVLVVAAGSGQLTVREEPDSKSYVVASELAPAEMLDSFRTIGYPLLLKGVARVSGDLRIMPWLHLAAYLGAVFLFELAWRRFGASPGQACAAASGVLYTVFYSVGISYVLTDCLARALAVATMSFLLWVTASPKRVTGWVGLTVSLACTYHVRPAYLFLVPLTPCLGLVFLRIRTGWRGDRFRWFAPTLGLCGVSVVPYLAFCLMRLVMVGHFGLVSFAGCNLVAVAAELIDRDLVESRLPESLRPLGREILNRREARGVPSATGRGGIDLRQLEANYNTNFWDIALPAAMHLYGEDPVVINRRVADLSRAAILARKGLYVQFVVKNLAFALNKAVVLHAFGFLAFLAFAVRVLVYPGPAPEPGIRTSGRHQGTMEALLLGSLLFLLCKLLLVSLVELPLARYVLAAGVFVPSIFSVLIYQEVGRIWRSGRCGG